MTRRKLKKEVWYVLIFIIVALILFVLGKNFYEDYQYQQTYEYKMITHGYTKSEYDKLSKVFPGSEIEQFLNTKKDSLYLKVIEEEYFIKKNFQDYIDYYNSHKDIDLHTIITIINTNIDHEHYSLDYKTDMSKEYLILVNKYYQLDASYEPVDLVDVPIKYAWGTLGDVKVRQVAYDAFLNMWHAANEEGYYLMVKSGYRSYTSQEIVYNEYKDRYGDEYADKIAARPGYSEHQTGLTLDIYSKQNTNQKTFKDSETAKWLATNAHKYGFILRYPEDKENITGYSYEAWHFRYLGKDIATKVYESNLSYDEYYAYYLDK